MWPCFKKLDIGEMTLVHTTSRGILLSIGLERFLVQQKRYVVEVLPFSFEMICTIAFRSGNNLGTSATEIVQARLFFSYPTGLMALDLLNIYCPPVLSSSTADLCSTEFNMNDVLSAVCKDNDETKECTSWAILLGGDINAHAKLLD